MRKFYLLGFVACLSGFVYGQDLNTAKNLTQSQRFEDAEQVFQELIKNQPNNGDVYYYYGINIISSYITDPYSNSLANVAKDARTVFETGLKSDTINPLNLVGIGAVILFEKGDTAMADVYLRKAQSTLPKKVKKYTPKNFETLINLAVAEIYAKSPRYYRAVALAEMAKAGAPLNAEACIALGDIYISQSMPSPAIQNYNRALYLDPKNVSLMVKIGNIYIRAKNLTESRNYFERAKEIDSTFAPLYKGLGEAYSMGGRYKFAKENYRKFLDLSGNNIPAKVSYINSLFKAKDYTELLNQVDDVLKVDSKRNYLNRLAAYSAYEKKPADYAKSLKYIETFFANTTPDKIITKDYAYYGRILLKIKQDSLQIDKGFEMLKKAYDDDTTDLDILAELAVNAYFQKRFPLAIEMLNRKIAYGKATSSDYMYLGKTYYQSGQYGKADTVFTQVTQMEPDNMQAYLWIANTYASLDPDSKLGLAKPKYEMVIEKGMVDSVKNSKEIVEAYSYMISYYIFTNIDFNNAELFSQKLVTLDPANKKWQIKGYKSMGIIYTKKKDYPKAISFYKKAMTLDPADTDSQKAIDGLNEAIEAAKKQKK